MIRSLVLTGCVILPAAQTTLRLGPSLYSVFEHGSPDSAISVLSGDARRAVEDRLAARRAYRYQIELPSASQDGPERWLLLSRQRLEAFLVTVSNHSEARAEAVQVARSARMFYEWEGEADPPLKEADYLEKYLLEHPKTLLAPALNLVLLHRYRSAFEAAVFERTMGPGSGGGNANAAWDKTQDALKTRAAAGYLAAWARLESVRDVVIRAVADDLDEQAFLYQNAGGEHPRGKK